MRQWKSYFCAWCEMVCSLCIWTEIWKIKYTEYTANSHLTLSALTCSGLYLLGFHAHLISSKWMQNRCNFGGGAARSNRLAQPHDRAAPPNSSAPILLWLNIQWDQWMGVFHGSIDRCFKNCFFHIWLFFNFMKS